MMCVKINIFIKKFIICKFNVKSPQIEYKISMNDIYGDVNQGDFIIMYTKD